MKRRTAEQLKAAERYWTEATDFVRRNSDDPRKPNWFVIEDRHSAKFERWKEYFSYRLGFMPVALLKFERHEINSFLVPTEQPEWFDSSFGRAA